MFSELTAGPDSASYSQSERTLLECTYEDGSRPFITSFNNFG
jgi:hypothetical protein